MRFQGYERHFIHKITYHWKDNCLFYVTDWFLIHDTSHVRRKRVKYTCFGTALTIISMKSSKVKAVGQRSEILFLGIIWNEIILLAQTSYWPVKLNKKNRGSTCSFFWYWGKFAENPKMPTLTRSQFLVSVTNAPWVWCVTTPFFPGNIKKYWCQPRHQSFSFPKIGWSTPWAVGVAQWKHRRLSPLRSRVRFPVGPGILMW